MSDANLAKELKSIGIMVNSVYDLLKISGRQYISAIPILEKYAAKDEDPKIREGAIRALSDVAFKDEGGFFISLFKNEKDHFAKWAIGNAIYNTATKKIEKDIIFLVQDEKHGDARQMLILALGKLKSQAAVPLLKEMLSRGQFPLHILGAFGKMGDVSLMADIEFYLNHPRAEVRKEAKKALVKLGQLITKKNN